MVLEYLRSNEHVGAENAVKQRTIIQDTGLDRREIRREIEQINANIKSPNMISFNNEGIYLVNSVAEYRTLRARAIRAIKRNVKRIKKCDMMLNDRVQLDFEELWDEDENERGLL